jgi:hypothetical protein
MLDVMLFKTLFEMSPDRADFMSHLFSRRRPDGQCVDKRREPDIPMKLRQKKVWRSTWKGLGASQAISTG